MNIYILAAWQINVEFGEFNWLLTIYHAFVINLAVDRGRSFITITTQIQKNTRNGESVFYSITCIRFCTILRYVVYNYIFI